MHCSKKPSVLTEYLSRLPSNQNLEEIGYSEVSYRCMLNLAIHFEARAVHSIAIHFEARHSRVSHSVAAGHFVVVLSHFAARHSH